MTRLPAKTRGPLRAPATVGVPSTPEGPPDSHSGTPDGVLDESRGAKLKLLRFAAVRERTGLSRSTIWRLERRGAFPPHHRISANAVAWVEEDIAQWIRSKVAGIAV